MQECAINVLIDHLSDLFLDPLAVQFAIPEPERHR
jgi:hypothetical protein